MTILPNSAGERQPLTRGDWILIAISLAIAAASIAVVVRYFESAFPQASIEFRYDRNSSKEIADRLAAALQIDVSEMKHASRFDSDGHARIFLERSLELERANRLMGNDVLVWYWHHRWFRPLVEEELRIDVAPSGEIVGFTHQIPEDAAAPGLQRAVADPRAIPVAFLRMIGADVDDLRLVEESQRKLPRRLQRSYTFESMSIRPAGAPYRHTVTVDGSTVTSYRQHLDVPDSWLRSYRELRSKNAAAGSVDMILLAATMIGALVIFIIRLRRGDLALRFTLATGIACVILVGGVALNSIPAQLSYYDTTTSYPAFVGQIALQGIMQSLGTAMLLIVIVGAGEVLYRQRLPAQLAMPRIWSSRALTSRRVFRSLVLGYALVPLFMAYQVSFYLIARHYGAWAPAEVPYDDIVNTALPWVAVLFAGFFPAFSEEFLSRAFSIPFFQRIFRSRVFAIVIAGMIWGFGHATYPNQPFWLRGVEVGLAGIA
ncbi:MAG TPA: CPBP family intramembrane glutamic endopeptidase, partial [Thermoanaerobaculia bacterium]